MSEKIKWIKKTQGLYYHTNGACIKKGQVVEATKEELGSFAYLFRPLVETIAPIIEEPVATEENHLEPVLVDINDLPELKVLADSLLETKEEAEETKEEPVEPKEEEEDFFAEEEPVEPSITYSLKQAGKYFFVVNDTTKEKVNKKGVSKEEAEELLNELQFSNN